MLRAASLRTVIRTFQVFTQARNASPAARGSAWYRPSAPKGVELTGTAEVSSL
jgi:hypothetical protein